MPKGLDEEVKAGSGLFKVLEKGQQFDWRVTCVRSL